MIFVPNMLSHLFILILTTHTDLNSRSKMENSTINKKGVCDSSGKQFSFSNSHFFNNIQSTISIIRQIGLASFALCGALLIYDMQICNRPLF